LSPRRTSPEPDAKSKALAAQLREQILREGPISFRDWMASALYDSEFGYYQRSDLRRWGRAGDYRTAPETSQVFGATFGQYFADCFDLLGNPDQAVICEAGAGGGDFADACLIFLQDYQPAFFETVSYRIDEISRSSQKKIRRKLKSFGDKLKFESVFGEPAARWDGIIFSNELLDAFPVTRVMVKDGELRELRVAADRSGGFCWDTERDADLVFAEYLDEVGLFLVEGQTGDISLGARDWWSRAANMLRNGFLITVDYGNEAVELFAHGVRPDGSLRALADHQLQLDPLASPGRLDLTSSVDWTTIRNAGEAAGLETVFFGGLDRFLLEAGALDVLEQLAEERDEATVVSLRHSVRDLILPGGLAGSFQVLVQRKSPLQVLSDALPVRSPVL
jgi:SAM-dependent MidA family methyltransferase